MRPAVLVPLVLVATAIAVRLLLGGTPSPSPPPLPLPPDDAASHAPPPDEARTPAPQPPGLTGTLVVTVRARDGRPVPLEARAGYRPPGGLRRLRGRAADGTYRFTDAPVGRVVAVAVAEGFVDGEQPVVVTAGLTSEVVVELVPLDR